MTIEPAAASAARDLPGALLPGDAGYDEARVSFNGLLDRRPAVIVPCRTTDEVVAAVRAARAAGLPIAVRGGGHSVAGHSLPDGAFVVSLAPMRDVVIDPERRLGHAGGGALWNDVDAAAFAFDLAVPGGTFGDTGIGGLTLGGGIGWLMPRRRPDLRQPGRGGGRDRRRLRRHRRPGRAIRSCSGRSAAAAATSASSPASRTACCRSAPMIGGQIVYPASAAAAVFERTERLAAEHPTAGLPTFGLPPARGRRSRRSPSCTGSSTAPIRDRSSTCSGATCRSSSTSSARRRTSTSRRSQGSCPSASTTTGRATSSASWTSTCSSGSSHEVGAGRCRRLRVRPAGADRRGGTGRARGWRRLRAAGGGLERQRARDLGVARRRRPRDRLGAAGGVAARAGVAERRRVRQLLRRSTRRPTGSAPRTATSAGGGSWASNGGYDPDNVFRFNHNILPA